MLKIGIKHLDFRDYFALQVYFKRVPRPLQRRQTALWHPQIQGLKFKMYFFLFLCQYLSARRKLFNSDHSLICNDFMPPSKNIVNNVTVSRYKCKMENFILMERVPNCSSVFLSVIIEKLLRSTDVKRVYFLVRPKKNDSVQGRFEVWKNEPVSPICVIT